LTAFHEMITRSVHCGIDRVIETGKSACKDTEQHLIVGYAQQTSIIAQAYSHTYRCSHTLEEIGKHTHTHKHAEAKIDWRVKGALFGLRTRRKTKKYDSRQSAAGSIKIHKNKKEEKKKKKKRNNNNQMEAKHRRPSANSQLPPTPCFVHSSWGPAAHLYYACMYVCMYICVRLCVCF